MATATAQINVRLDSKLKEAGDRGLARRGITPSQAVRALWKTVGNDDLASQMACDVLLGLDEGEGLSEAVRARLEALNRFDATRAQFQGKLQHAGIDFSACSPLTEEEAREARYEYLLEKSGA